MRLGLGVLRLPPEAFWAMTPGEFRRALEGAGIVPIGGGARSMDRGRLAELMTAFPDEGVRASTHPTGGGAGHGAIGGVRASTHATAGGAGGGGDERG